MQIRCRTLFDITPTGTTGHFKSSQVPYNDRAGNKITDLSTWNRSRNQQRNFETILQVLQLRTQLFDLTQPMEDTGYWQFDFSIEFEGVYQLGNDVFGTLKNDCEGVPMLVGLDEEYAINPVLTTDGSQQNIWFEQISVNN